MDQKKPPGYDVGDPDTPRTEFESLHAFQRVMWDKLHANRHKGSWLKHNPSHLLRRLREEVEELDRALHALGQSVPGSELEAKNVEELTLEAADVANFAMMIADVCGGLSFQRRSGG